MPRTPLFAVLRRAARLARRAEDRDAPPVDELVELAGPRLSRRQFLGAAGKAGLAVGLGGVGLAGTTGCQTTFWSPGPRGTSPAAPRIAIIGGGLAGLNATRHLRRAGLTAFVYEGAKRTGGRMYTARGLLAPGLTTELGGEFIDSDHADVLELVRTLELGLLDMNADPEKSRLTDAFFFDGRQRTMVEIVEAFRPLARRMQADYARLGEVIDYRHEGGAAALDRTSLAQYLDAVGASGFMRKLLEVAYVTEFGLDADEQSALNLLMQIGLDTTGDEVELYGESDERFKVKGGNEQVVEALAETLRDQIRLEHRLESIRSNGPGYRLSFAGPGGAVYERNADVVLLTVPFSVLREVEVAIELPEVKGRAIHELGYGQNSKLLVGFHERVWRAQGRTGNALVDLPFQLAWDNSRMQDDEAGGLTLYGGGQNGREMGRGGAQDQGLYLLPGVEQIFPGMKDARNGRVERFHWPTFPFTRGSYSCYRAGQWTTIAGAEFEPVGNLFFAGEHCSREFQGFMNGAAETGRRAAAAIAERVGAPAAEPAAGNAAAV